MATGTMKVGTVGLGATQLYTNSLPRLTVSSGGNIGIGIITPSASLHISGASLANLLRIDSPASSSILFVSGSGNVGIGTASPATKLHVAGTQYISGDLRIGSSFGATNQTSIFKDQGAVGLGIFTWGDTAPVVIGGGHVIIRSESGANRNLYVTGNVGIGTTAPSQKLHVAGDALVTGSLTVNGTITAKEFKTEFVSASITYASGSHKFGDTLDDTHQVTGSMTITGSLGLKGILYDNLGTAGTPDQILFTTSTGVEWRDNVANSAQNLIITGKNVGGTTIPKGSPVYFTDSGTSGNLVGILSADAGDPDLMPAGGVVAQALDPGGEGDVFIYGFINGVNTSAFTSGDDVFVAVGGGYTNVKPTGSALIQKLGNVEKSDPTNGSGVIQGPSWYNDLPNWEEGRVMVGRSAGQPVTSSVVYLDESNGYMGIGTSLPFTEFHVEGTATVNNTLSFNGIASIYQNTNSNLNINNPGWGFVGKGIDITAAGLLTLTATETYIPTGDVGIGESNPGVKLHVAGNISGSTIYASGDVIAYYSSDRRLKDNITPIKDPIAKLQQIGGYEFDWNENQDIYTGHDVGVVAQEIEAILPSLVTTTGTGYKGVKYEKLVALLIEGIKDQQKQIDELREEIKNLKK
jgi:hypothetical protein